MAEAPVPNPCGHVLIAGFGTMTQAMLTGWLRAGYAPASFTVYNPRAKPVPGGVRMVTEWPDRAPDTIILGFKPQLLPELAPAMQSLAGQDTLVISILGGVGLTQLGEAFPEAGGIVRFMPNLAVALNLSPILLAGSVDDRIAARVTGLADALGHAEWMAQEAGYDAATALAGSGPAFLYRVIDGFAEAGSRLGLDDELAARLALGMVHGAAVLAAGADRSPAQLADEVASPNGMTRRGLDVLDDCGVLAELLTETLRAARDRGAEMAAEAAGKG